VFLVVPPMPTLKISLECCLHEEEIRRMWVWRFHLRLLSLAAIRSEVNQIIGLEACRGNVRGRRNR
jgi:hypothetical protein